MLLRPQQVDVSTKAGSSGELSTVAPARCIACVTKLATFALAVLDLSAGPQSVVPLRAKSYVRALLQLLLHSAGPTRP